MEVPRRVFLHVLDILKPRNVNSCVFVKRNHTRDLSNSGIRGITGDGGKRLTKQCYWHKPMRETQQPSFKVTPTAWLPLRILNYLQHERQSNYCSTAIHIVPSISIVPQNKGKYSCPLQNPSKQRQEGSVHSLNHAASALNSASRNLLFFSNGLLTHIKWPTEIPYTPALAMCSAMSVFYMDLFVVNLIF